MRSADRSLEITALGLGQAGGRIAAEFSRRGYRALAFDNAKTDLDSLGAGALALPDAQRIYIGVEGSDGRECIAAHAERIRAAVAEHAAGADVVVVAAGLGEGIGSCAPELVAMLREQGLPVVVLSTLAETVSAPVSEPSPRADSDSAQPSRGRYERLANAFRETTEDDERAKIAQELAETLQAGDTLERFYAVNAMARVDAAYFRDALRTAARDADRHVADLARRVLEKLSRSG